MLHRTMLSMALAGALALGPSALAAGPPRDGDAIAKMLQSDSPQDVATALRVLAGTPTVGLEDALVRAARRAEPELSSAALDLLAQTGDPRAVDLLEAAIRSADPSRVSVGCVWLPRYGTLGLEAAERLLEDPDPLVRRAVARTLKWFPPSPELQGVIERAVAQSRAKRAARLATAPR